MAAYTPGRKRVDRSSPAPADIVDATAPVLTIDTTPIAEVEDVLTAIDDPGQIIWDVRSREEYLGLRSASARSRAHPRRQAPGLADAEGSGTGHPAG